MVWFLRARPQAPNRSAKPAVFSSRLRRESAFLHRRPGASLRRAPRVLACPPMEGRMAAADPTSAALCLPRGAVTSRPLLRASGRRWCRAALPPRVGQHAERNHARSWSRNQSTIWTWHPMRGNRRSDGGALSARLTGGVQRWPALVKGVVAIAAPTP